jgi:hypothetical protein
MAETKNSPADPFFIGWKPMPASYRRFLVPVALALIAACSVVAVMIAGGQQSPGNGVWQDDSTTFEGIVYASPYATLRTPGEKPGDATRTVFLVEEGKFGASDRVRSFDGQPVRVKGSLLHRDDRWMLELAQGAEGIQPTTIEEPRLAKLSRPAFLESTTVTLRGEIIDSKCYLGAMKPGGGKTHKCCAALCIMGGIPPMLVTRDSSGKEAYYLLTNADGGPLGQNILPFVGDQVELKGQLEQQGDLAVIRVSPADIRRR